MARRYDSEAVRNRVLSTSVRLFLERGYHGTTMAAILKESRCVLELVPECLRKQRRSDV